MVHIENTVDLQSVLQSVIGVLVQYVLITTLESYGVLQQSVTSETEWEEDQDLWECVCVCVSQIESNRECVSKRVCVHL